MKKVLIFVFSVLGTAVVSLLIGYFSGVVVARDAYDACAEEKEECWQDVEDARKATEECSGGFKESLENNKDLLEVAKQLKIDVDAAKAELAEAEQ